MSWAEVLLWPPRGLLPPGGREKGERDPGFVCGGCSSLAAVLQMNWRRWWGGLRLGEVRFLCISGSWNAWHGECFGLDFPEVPEAGAPQGGPLGCEMLLSLTAASACRRIVKVPDHPEALCFQIRGAAPSYVYAVGKGEWESDRQRGARETPSVCV